MVPSVLLLIVEAIVWKSRLSSHDLSDIGRKWYEERSLVRR